MTAVAEQQEAHPPVTISWAGKSRQIVSLDTETDLMAADNVNPRLVCATIARKHANGFIDARLLAHCDTDCRATIEHLLTSDDFVLVGHNIAFDLAVMAREWPDLLPLIWAKLTKGLVTDTAIREKLLNISTHGQLEQLRRPDGSSARLGYRLTDLERKYMGIDRSKLKEGSGDIWRLNYKELLGVESFRYPPDAAEYAKDDAINTLAVFYAQHEARLGAVGRGSTATEEFQTASAFALRLATISGLPVDEAGVERLRAALTAEMETLVGPLVELGLVVPAQPEKPYKADVKKLTALLPGADVEALTDEQRTALKAAGIRFLAPVKEKKNNKALAALVEQVCVAKGMRIKRTKKGAVKTSDEVLKQLEPFVPAFRQFRQRQSVSKTLGSFVKPLIGVSRVHPDYDVLKETARTSSYGGKLYPSINVQQQSPQIRGCFVAPQGSLFCSVDYSAIELASFAQKTYSLLGHSTHRELIAAGVDLHAYLGAQLALRFDKEFAWIFRGIWVPHRGDSPVSCYQFFIDHKKSEKDEARALYKKYRVLAKPVGLGFPGGMGAATFVDTAMKKPHNLDLVAIGQERAAGHPEEFARDIWAPRLWRYGKMFGWKCEDDFTFDVPLAYGWAMAAMLKDIWLATYPEAKPYFKWVTRECVDPNNVLRFKIEAEVAEDDDDEDDAPTSEDGDDGAESDEQEEAGVSSETAYCYHGPMGFYRAGTTYCAAANGAALQTPTAFGAKLAHMRIARACTDPTLGSILYGCPVPQFIHDEVFATIPDDGQAHERAHEIARLMVDSMQRFFPDVVIRAEPALMRVWTKAAEAVWGEDGRLKVWEPPAEKPPQAIRG